MNLGTSWGAVGQVFQSTGDMLWALSGPPLVSEARTRQEPAYFSCTSWPPHYFYF